MWQKIVDYFQDAPMRLQVAQAIIRHGFKVREPGDITCGSIRIPLKSIGDALGVDRRTVRVTTEDICADEELFNFFSNLEPAGSSLEGVRKMLGYGVVTIHVESPENPGILSQVTSTIAGYGVPIRQVIAEDVAIHKEPCLKVITQTPLPGAAIEVLSSIAGVSRVILEQ
ncbi:amino acid-binding protein [Candidatus Thorarchaeota archaeon]|nr:MAG: amino acid-binding protein [Candidatus Thorarchaeota archaeon]